MSSDTRRDGGTARRHRRAGYSRVGLGIGLVCGIPSRYTNPGVITDQAPSLGGRCISDGTVTRGLSESGLVTVTAARPGQG
eukprot:764704-Hanusia_phi.AAC.2